MSEYQRVNMSDNSAIPENQPFDAVAELGKLLGLSKSASLAFAVLFTSEQPLSLDDVATHTGIAKSSISVILKNLEQFGLSEVVDKPHDRRKYYQIVDDPGEAITALFARRLDIVNRRQQDSLAYPGSPISPQLRQRLNQLAVIYDSLDMLADFLHMQRAAAWDELRHRLG